QFLNGNPRGIVQGQALRLSAHLLLRRPSTALKQSTGSTPRFPNPTCNTRSTCRRDPLSSRRKSKSGHPRPPCHQRRRYRSSASRLPSPSPPYVPAHLCCSPSATALMSAILHGNDPPRISDR